MDGFSIRPQITFSILTLGAFFLHLIQPPRHTMKITYRGRSSLSLSLSLSLSSSHSHSHTYTHTLSLSLSHTHTHSHTLPHASLDCINVRPTTRVSVPVSKLWGLFPSPGPIPIPGPGPLSLASFLSLPLNHSDLSRFQFHLFNFFEIWAFRLFRRSWFLLVWQMLCLVASMYIMVFLDLNSYLSNLTL